MTEEFQIDIDDNLVRGEIHQGTPMIVFSHGFGVERSSSGMFTDIVNSLPTTYGYILFDYSEINGNTWTVSGLETMRKKLETVINKAAKNKNNVIIIAHSLGCIIASLAEKVTKRVIFLAPPTRTITGSWKESFVHQRKDRAHIDELGHVHLIRKRDNQEMIIQNDWFDEMVTMPGYIGMEKLAKTGRLSIIEAEDDADIKDRRRYKALEKQGAKLITLQGNHNFDHPHRYQLCQTILDLLE
jgi:surfactin synthase thioesterase subunit